MIKVPQTNRPCLSFGTDTADEAFDEWKFNCGPGAICALTGLTPAEIRPYLGDFERKGYTNPTLMREILKGLNIAHWTMHKGNDTGSKNLRLYHNALLRIQFDGPWTKPGVPIAARYCHTHWIAMSDQEVFDINAVCAGGWISIEEWTERLLPWLIKETSPKANGDWWITHVITIQPGSAIAAGDKIRTKAGEEVLK